MTQLTSSQLTAPVEHDAASASTGSVRQGDAYRSDSITVAQRPWSAIVVGLPGDGTLLVVDWLVLACRISGFIAQASPLRKNDRDPHGMYIEVAEDESLETELGSTQWGAVDLVVAGEHLELARAMNGGFVDDQATTIVSSCRRSFTPVERVIAPQRVLTEREIDTFATKSSHAYHGFDGPEVLRWYGLPAKGQPGLIFGALCGSGATGLDEDACIAAIKQLGVDAALHLEAFKRGIRLGRRTGGRIRRPKTAYQFTRKRRALISHESRRKFEQLVEQCEDVVAPADVPALQHAIFLACEFQDADWASRLVNYVADIARHEREVYGEVDADKSVVSDSIKALAAMMIWQDAAWVANRKRRANRHKELRAAHGITRKDTYELLDIIPLDAEDLNDTRHPKLRSIQRSDLQSSLLRTTRFEVIRSTTLRGALRLRRLAASARFRDGSLRQRREIDTTETWLEALHDALKADHGLAQIVAKSGTIVQGMGAVREAHRQTAHAFWGRIVRQALALDRQGNEGEGEALVAKRVVPFVWEQLCRSGSLALWEYASQVLGVALAHSRGLSYAQAVEMADAICVRRRLSVRPQA